MLSPPSIKPPVVSALDKVSINQGTNEIWKSGEPRRLYYIPLTALYNKTCLKPRRQRSRTKEFLPTDRPNLLVTKLSNILDAIKNKGAVSLRHGKSRAKHILIRPA